MSLSRQDIKYFKLAVGLDRIKKETDVDISAKCPVCGDSQKKHNSARLHLYNKGEVTNVSCFNGNCSVHNKTVYSFLRDFYPALLSGYKKETFKNTISTMHSGDVFKQFNSTTTEKETNTSEVQTQDLSAYMTDISESNAALQYLINRGLPYDGSYGKWYYGHQNLKIGDITYPITDSIVIPLYYNNEMYGFYSRSIRDKSFYTYMDQRNIGYKIFNWFNINKNEACFIFEGIFDCISSGLKNSIALMGAKLPDDRLKELKNPVFVLDNDKTGLTNALDYSRLGCNVYIQPKEYMEKDMNELMLNHSELNISMMIKRNIFTSIQAEVRIKGLL